MLHNVTICYAWWRVVTWVNRQSVQSLCSGDPQHTLGSVWQLVGGKQLSTHLPSPSPFSGRLLRQHAVTQCYALHRKDDHGGYVRCWHHLWSHWQRLRSRGIFGILKIRKIMEAFISITASSVHICTLLYLLCFSFPWFFFFSFISLYIFYFLSVSCGLLPVLFLHVNGIVRYPHR